MSATTQLLQTMMHQAKLELEVLEMAKSGDFESAPLPMEVKELRRVQTMLMMHIATLEHSLNTIQKLRTM